LEFNVPFQHKYGYIRDENIEEHQKIRKLKNKRLKVRIDDLFIFRKWWRHTRKTQPNSLL